MFLGWRIAIFDKFTKITTKQDVWKTMYLEKQPRSKDIQNFIIKTLKLKS